MPFGQTSKIQRHAIQTNNSRETYNKDPGVSNLRNPHRHIPKNNANAERENGNGKVKTTKWLIQLSEPSVPQPWDSSSSPYPPKNPPPSPSSN